MANNLLAVFSTAYLPPIEYIHLALKHGRIILEKHETYSKQTYRNRCIILSANGTLPLIIPVVKPNGNRTKICDIRIDNSVKWRKEHWRAIESAYKGSAFFEFILDYFVDFYKKERSFLWDFNIEIISTIFNLLEMDIKIQETSEYERDFNDYTKDYRNCMSPKKRYIYCNTEFEPIPYFQVFGISKGFEPNLSIFDMICNCGMESVKYLE